MKLPFELQDPRGLWLLAGLVPLIVLYLLKVRRARVEVASTWLWAAARRDLMARSPLKRLVVQVPLILQILALCLLALALARPATRHKAILGDHIAIVVDTSASMGAIDAASGVPRIELARRAAKRAVSALSPGADAMIVEAARDARVVVPLDRDRDRLESAISDLAARDVEGDLGAAVALAVDRLKAAGGERRLLVFTDGDLANPDALSAVSAPMEVFSVGEKIDNAAIVRVDVRAGTDAATHEEEVQGFAVLANFGGAPRDLFVTLRLANVDEPLASRRLRLEPGERAPVVLTFRPTQGDRNKGLVFDIAPHDGLPADDVAFARVPPGQKQPALIASTRPSPWFERALRSDPFVEVARGTPAEVLASGAEQGALFVFDGVCPAEPPAGDFVVVGPPAGTCLGITVGATVDKPAITSWANGDARFRFLTMDGVHLAKATPLRADGAAQTLVRGPNDVLVADVSSPGRSGTILGFDLAETDWPLKASFVLFVRNVVEIARSHRAQGATGTVRPGDPLRVPVPIDATNVRVATPGVKDSVPVSARDGLAVVADTGRAGHYLVSWEGAHAGSVLVPVSLTSERESDLRKRPLSTSAASATVSDVAKLADAHTDWSYLAALVALALLVADAWWFTRRPAPAPRVVTAPPRPDRSRT